MALFKILKGPESGLPTDKHEGWAYVTNEGNFYVDISDTVRVKINGNADEATKATYDSADQKITDTYIKDIILNDSTTKPYYTFMLGNGTLRDADGDGTTDQLLIPVASSSKAGVVTTSTQTLKGKKTFSSLITASAGLTSKADITTGTQFVSTLADGTAPFNITSTTMSPNLNADMVDGMHASNLPFNNESSSETIVPTQRAIWSSLNDLLVAAHALVYRGTIDPNRASTHPNAPSVGDVYIISAEGTFAGIYCEPGDMAIYYASGWDIVQVNINGAVTIKTGGAYNSLHATVNAIPRFDETSGRVIKNSKVTIDDNGHMVPADNGAQNLGSTGNLWGTIYGNSFTGTANQATHDDSGQVIKNTYIKDSVYVQDDSAKSGSKSSPYLKYLFGHGTNPVYLAMPVAGAQQGGIITAGAQNISGVKTLNATDGGLIIPKADSFQYSGIKADTAASTTKYIWFSTTGGVPKYNTGLAFNPSCSDAWASYDGTTVTAYKVITTDRFKGLSLKALQDDQGQVIKNIYLQDVILNTSASAPYYTLKLGNGTLKDTDGTSGADKVIIPVASASQAGVITADKSNTQTLTGPKKIDANGSLEIAGSNAFKYTGIQNGTSNDTHYLWFADKDAVGVPLKNTSLSFNPAASVKWSHDTANVTAAVLTVARLNGIALQALQDSQGKVIDDVYLQDVILNNSASAPYYTLKLGNGTLKDTDGTSGADKVIIPVASATQAGIITADKSNAQTITGEKIIDANGSLEIKKAAGFNYSAIQNGDSAGARSVWFSHISKIGTPCISGNFKFDPDETLNTSNWTNETSGAKSSVLHVPHIDGLAYRALRDSQGLVIDDTYIKNIVFVTENVANVAADGASKPYLKFTLGNGADHVYVQLPVASATIGGILSTDAQEIKGKKTFKDGIAAKLTATESTDGTYYPWFSNFSSNIGTPTYDTGLSYNPSSNTLTTTTFKGALDGLAAKATADASGQTITSTYLKDITYSDYKFTVKLGSGTTLRTLSPLFAASSSCGGDATKAVRWSNAVTIQLEGEVTGSASIVGNEGTVKITTSLANTNLTALNSKYIRKDQADGTSYVLTLSNTTDLNATLTTAQGALIVKGGVHVAKQLYASKVHNAVWNDYAECRKAETIEPGRVVVEHESGEMKISSERLQAGGSIISDTFGSCMGETAECKTPIAVAGRVLAYTYEDRNTYPLGAAVCAAPNGTVSVMTREEIREYPERILGTVSEIPDYEVWGTGNIQVNNRIWIKVR